MKVTFLNHKPTPKEIAAYRAPLPFSDPAMEAVEAYEDAWDYPTPEQQKRFSGLLEEE